MKYAIVIENDCELIGTAPNLKELAIIVTKLINEDYRSEELTIYKLSHTVTNEIKLTPVKE